MLALFGSIPEGSQKRNIGHGKKYFTNDGRGRGENTFCLKVLLSDDRLSDAE
jgi:hypothetical protein